MSISGPQCNDCGAPRPLPEPERPREPCPACGSTAQHYKVTATETVRVTASAKWEMTPGEQGRDWAVRLDDLERRAASVARERTAAIDRDAVVGAAAEAKALVVDLYSFKDHLKDASAVHGVPGADIEAHVSNTPTLSLLADLANTIKHGALNKPPRSGAAPTIRDAAAASGTDGGWRVRVPFNHRGDSHDATAFTAAAAAEWRRFMQDRGAC